MSVARVTGAGEGTRVAAVDADQAAWLYPSHPTTWHGQGTHISPY